LIRERSWILLGEMIEIRDYRDPESLTLASVCTLNYEKGYELAGMVRRRWLKWMMRRGLSGLVAYEGKTPVGFFEFIPIEEAPDRIQGKDLIYIICGMVHLWDRPERKRYTGRGIGRMLIERIERVAKRRAKGVVAWGYDWDSWYMPAGFFRHLGYEEVDREGKRVLLLKRFKRVEPPRFIRKDFEFTPIKGKVVIDIFSSEQCPFFISLVSKWQQVVKGMGKRYFIRIHQLRTNRDFIKFGRGMSILINGRPIPLGPMSSERIKEILLKEGR